MVDVFHYLELRAQGLTHGHHFRECRKVVRNLLEDVSAKPVHNLPCEFSGEPRATFLMDFSPNMLRVASTHGDHTVRVTDIRTGKCTHILTGHPRTPWCLAFNPASNDILASGCLGGEIRIWDLLGGGSEVLLNPCVGQVITSLAFHPTGQVLVFATMNYIYFWDWSQATPFSFTRTTHDYERIRWLRFDPLGQYLYTGIANNTTVHRDREGVARVVAINDALDLSAEGDDRSTQQHLNRLRYQRLLQRFMAFQQDHNRPAYPGMPPLSPESRSPVHEEGLDNARQYARHVTNIAARTASNNAETASSSLPILRPWEENSRSARPSLFSARPAETSGSSAASSSQPSSLYQGTRNENAASESLDANEFEILPVDQEREALPSARVSSSSLLSSRLASQLLPPGQEPPAAQQESINSLLRNSEGAPLAMGTSDNTGVHIHFDSGVSHSWRRGLGLRHHSVDEESEFRLHSSLLDRTTPRHVIDQTSQTLGAMNLPESSDQCTDVSDLGEHHQRADVSGLGEHGQGDSHLMGGAVRDTAGHSEVTRMCVRRNVYEGLDENMQPLRITIPREPLSCEFSNEGGDLAFSEGVSNTRDDQSQSCISVDSRSTKMSILAAGVDCNLRDDVCTLPLKKRGRKIQSADAVVNSLGFSTSEHACPLHASRQTGSLVGGGGEGSSRHAGPSQLASCSDNEQICADSSHTREIQAGACTDQSNTQLSKKVGEGQSGMVCSDPKDRSEDNERLGENWCPSTVEDNKLGTSVVPEPEMYSPERPTSDCSENESSTPVGTMAAESLLDVCGPSTAAVRVISSTSSSSTSSLSSSPSLSLSSVISSSSQDTQASSALLGTTSLHLLPVISMSTQSSRAPPDSPGVSNRLAPREYSALHEQNRTIPPISTSGETRQTQIFSNGMTSPTLDGEQYPNIRPSMFATTPCPWNIPRSSSDSILRASLVRPSSSDVRAGLRRFTDSSQPSAFSIFSTPARELTRSPSVLRTSSLQNPASANPASSSGLYPPATRSASDQSSTSSPPEGEASSQRQLNAVRDVQERLQQAVQQLREVHTSVRELSSTAPNDDINIMGPDSVTQYLERRVSELDRRISDLEESYNSRIRELRHDYLMRRIQSSRERRRPVNNSPYFRRYSARLRESLRGRERASSSLECSTSSAPDVHSRSGSSRPVDGSGDAPPVRPRSGQLLECLVRRDTSLPTTSQRSARASEMPASVTIRPAREEDNEDSGQRYYLNLHHAHLHPDYSSSILDDTINRPTDTVQRIMNRTIAGAFLTRDDQAVASNIVPQTHRIQRWDVSKCVVPDITNASINIVVKHCKLHNDASCDLSKDGTFLATFVPSHRGFPDDNILGVFSLRKESLAHCLYTKSFGPNAISVSISPENRYVMVGLAAKRLFFFSVNQMVAQVYRLAKEKAGESSMRHVTDLFHPCNQDSRNHVSVNSARWLPGVGEGMVYGTNRGDLHFCRPGSRKVHERDSPKPRGPHSGLESMIRLHRNHSAHNSIATQTTTVSIRRSASTQTSRDDDHDL
ncbi:unnamed protein product [Lymnaea stagnalis]|uniref:Activating molecule in BECN1-regulated autophagy protein 1 n=1 Tax=Lymnaea stagnalis TaxID=6523 RepID=A0AAV2IPA4_LYMST